VWRLHQPLPTFPQLTSKAKQLSKDKPLFDNTKNMLNKTKIEYAVITLLVLFSIFQFFQVRGVKKDLEATKVVVNTIGGTTKQIVDFINQAVANQPK
jgi:hypothetical protein